MENTVMMLKLIFFSTDYPSTRKRHRRSKSKETPAKDCPEINDENMTIEILKAGRM